MYMSLEESGFCHDGAGEGGPHFLLHISPNVVGIGWRGSEKHYLDEGDRKEGKERSGASDPWALDWGGKPVGQGKHCKL